MDRKEISLELLQLRAGGRVNLSLILHSALVPEGVSADDKRDAWVAAQVSDFACRVEAIEEQLKTTGRLPARLSISGIARRREIRQDADFTQPYLPIRQMSQAVSDCTACGSVKERPSLQEIASASIEVLSGRDVVEKKMMGGCVS